MMPTLYFHPVLMLDPDFVIWAFVQMPVLLGLVLVAVCSGVICYFGRPSQPWYRVMQRITERMVIVLMTEVFAMYFSLLIMADEFLKANEWPVVMVGVVYAAIAFPVYTLYRLRALCITHGWSFSRRDVLLAVIVLASYAALYATYIARLD